MAELDPIKIRVHPDGRMDRANTALYLDKTPQTLANWAVTGKGPKPAQRERDALLFRGHLRRMDRCRDRCEPQEEGDDAAPGDCIVRASRSPITRTPPEVSPAAFCVLTRAIPGQRNAQCLREIHTISQAASRTERRRRAASGARICAKSTGNCGGCLIGRVIRPEHFTAALLGPLTDAADLQDIRAVIDWFPMAAKADPPPLCLCCDEELSADGATIRTLSL